MKGAQAVSPAPPHPLLTPEPSVFPPLHGLQSGALQTLVDTAGVIPTEMHSRIIHKGYFSPDTLQGPPSIPSLRPVRARLLGQCRAHGKAAPLGALIPGVLEGEIQNTPLNSFKFQAGRKEEENPSGFGIIQIPDVSSR